MSVVREQIQRFFESERVFRDRIGSLKMEADTALLELGILDSIGIFELVGFLEARFHFKVESQDLVEANFRSLSAIERYVAGKTAPAMAP